MTPSPTDPFERLHLYAKLVAAATFILVLAGGLVTSTGSGLSVPDWPLSFGQVFPPMVGGVRFEHSHRLIATGVGFLTIILTIWLWQVDHRPLLRGLGVVALVAVVLQGLLGGLTVLLKLPPVVSVAHACLGQTFFCINVAIAVLTSLKARVPFQPVISAQARKLRRLALFTTLVIFLQLVAGGIVRHTGAGLHWHFLGAAIVMVHILLLARRIFHDYGDDMELRQPAAILCGLLGLQLMLGLYSWQSGTVGITTAHVGVGALIYAVSVILSIQSFRRVVPE